MGKIIDLTGEVFDQLEVIKFDEVRNHKAYWWCKCSCGNPNLVSISGHALRQGQKSCGKCLQFEMIGKKFNHLTVLEVDLEYKITHNIKGKEIYYKCQCDCENKTILTVNGCNLRRGNTKSCGCYAIQQRSNKFKDITGEVFGFLKALYPTDKRAGESIIWHCVCLRDGNECDVSSGHLISGHTQSCGCSKSLGEANIQNLLQKNSILFEKEKTFEDLINDKKYQYRYDFYLPNYNRLIEFDGIQHYNYNDQGWNTKEAFEKRQQSDRTKNKYALDNNISLVRIPYWERDNITLEMLLGDKYLVTELEDEQIIF